MAPSNSDIRASSLRQASLRDSFLASKRTKSVGKTKPTVKSTPISSSADEPEDITLLSSEEESEDIKSLPRETELKAKEKTTVSVKSAKKQPEHKASPGDVLRRKENFENTGPRSKEMEVVSRPKLNPRDPKWRELHKQAQEAMDYMKPIHADNQNKIHEILRVFDLTFDYGPCVGVSRLERWERAEALGLNPPPRVREILTTQEGIEEPTYAQCVFSDEV